MSGKCKVTTVTQRSAGKGPGSDPDIRGASEKRPPPPIPVIKDTSLEQGPSTREPCQLLLYYFFFSFFFLILKGFEVAGV